MSSFEEVVVEFEKIRAKCGKITGDNDVEIKTCQIKQKEHIDHDFIGIWGQAGVNVLKLNVALDQFAPGI